jgi:hypothetical protein
MSYASILPISGLRIKPSWRINDLIQAIRERKGKGLARGLLGFRPSERALHLDIPGEGVLVWIHN